QRNRADRSPGAGRPGRTHRRSGGPPHDVCAADAGGRKEDRGNAGPGAGVAAQDGGRPLHRGAGAIAACLSPAYRQHDRRPGSREEERMSENVPRNPTTFTDSSGHLTEGLTRWRTIAVVAGTMLALLLAALDQTIVGTAMPRIVAELNGLSYYSWVITAYLVASTIMVPIAGKLGDLFGRKPFLLAGMIGFVVASALCGQSHSMLELVAFRTIQGLFGGMLFATVFAVIGDLFPPARRARLAGLFGAVFGLSSIVGPTAGGYITDTWGWRWVFYVNLPVGLIAVLMVLATMPFVRSSASIRDIDFPGAAALIAGLVPLIYQGVPPVTATHSGQLLTPMMLGLIVASTLIGQAMVRIRYYRFLGTAGVAVMLVGMWLLSQVTVSTPKLEVVRDIVIV